MIFSRRILHEFFSIFRFQNSTVTTPWLLWLKNLDVRRDCKVKWGEIAWTPYFPLFPLRDAGTQFHRPLRLLSVCCLLHTRNPAAACVTMSWMGRMARSMRAKAEVPGVREFTSMPRWCCVISFTAKWWSGLNVGMRVRSLFKVRARFRNPVSLVMQNSFFFRCPPSRAVRNRRLPGSFVQNLRPKLRVPSHVQSILRWPFPRHLRCTIIAAKLKVSWICLL